MNRVLFAVMVLVGSQARADEFDGTHALTSEERANIELDQDKAHKEIEERHKDDSSGEGRAAKVRELQEADAKVLESHGTSDHDYRTQGMRSSPDEQKAVAGKKEELRAQREKEAKAKEDAAKPKEDGAVEVVKGFDEDHPLNLDQPGSGGSKKGPALDADGNPMPSVEKGFSEEEMAAKGGTGEGEAKASDAPKDVEIAVPPSVEPGTEVIEAPSAP